MPSCERCWSLAAGDPDEYSRLVAIENCTPEQQAGECRTTCNQCGRRTVHQHAKICMTCGDRTSP